MSTASLALPSVAQAQSKRVLKFIPYADLATLDPLATTGYITLNHGYMVYDTLYGQTGQQFGFKCTPQMVKGHVVENDGKTWMLTLRDGLLFHNGENVLATDCVASIKRWGVRDLFGQALMARTDEVSAPDDKTIVFRLKQPFPLLPDALGHACPNMCAIMPKHIAETDPFKQFTEVVGSGPFRFVANEYVAGNLAVFAKFERYSPRSDPVSFAAGGYRVMVDRVEWRIIPDSATAANALAAGEVDWLDAPLPDLLPMLRKASGVTVGPIDIYGTFGGMRLNQLQGPTTNAGVRRAMLAAVDQVEVMTAVMGDEKSLYRAPVGYFLPGTPSANDAGMDAVRKRPGTDEIKAMLKQAGYAGERVVLMHPTDQTFYDAMSSVVSSSLRRVGINLDEQSLDWGTVVQRRTSKEPLDKGGWSLFPYGAPAAEYRDPIFATNLRGNGKDAWFGWPTDDKVEAMRTAWMDSNDDAERKRLDAEIQARAFETVPFIPLGQYLPPSAWRSNLTGVLKGAVPVFWNVSKA